jgi:hypothetical protein
MILPQQSQPWSGTAFPEEIVRQGIYFHPPMAGFLLSVVIPGSREPEIIGTRPEPDPAVRSITGDGLV